MNKTDKKAEILKAIMVLADGSDTVLKKETMDAWVNDLLSYPMKQLILSFERCRKTLMGKLSLGFIIKTIDDGRDIPACHRELPALPAPKDEIPEARTAALFRVAREGMGRDWSKDEIEEKVQEILNTNEKGG